MGVHHAMYSAITGMQANANNLSVIANNIANTNTFGFKAERAEFRDLLSVSLNERSDLGRGTMLRNIRTLFSQGAMIHTGQNLDLSVHGNGFFIVQAKDSRDEDPTGLFYTRDGSFQFDHEGYITDAEGNRVQGYLVDASQKLQNNLTSLHVSAVNNPPKATSLINIAVNLDSRSQALPVDFSLENPQGTSNYSMSTPVYDSMGQAHNMNIYFCKSKDKPQEWTWYALLPSDSIEGGKKEFDADGNLIPTLVGQGKVEFNEKGQPILKYLNKSGQPVYYDESGMSDAFEVQFNNGSKLQRLQLNFGPEVDPVTREVGRFSSSYVASDFNVIYQNQNGHEAGSLKSIKVESDGSIYGDYSNGKKLLIGTVALAMFNNNHGLEKTGGNRFAYKPDAGHISIGRPETLNFGSVFSNTLESSNVDMTNEFVDMIHAQRAFQANSKAIRTSDSLLEEILSLKY